VACYAAVVEPNSERGDEIAAVIQRHEGIRLAFVFGSRARGDASAHSDVDVAVLAQAPLGSQELGRLVEELQAVFGEIHVDLVDLATAAPLVCAEVVRDGVLLHGSAEEQLAFEQRVFHRAQDTQPLRRVQQELIREAARYGRPT